MYGLIKIANEQQEKTHWGDAALATGGGLATLNAKDRILGRKTLYHGTSAENAAKIKQEGFKLSDGMGGASEALGEQQFIDNSKGKIHMSPQRGIANGFAMVADDPKLKEMKTTVNGLRAQLEASDLESVPVSEFADHVEKRTDLQRQIVSGRRDAFDHSSKLLARGIITPPQLSAGETLKMSVPYGDFRAMQPDPDMFPGADEEFVRQLAVRTDTPPGLEYIKGSVDDIGRAGRLKESLRLMPDYIKAHPGRFGSGVGLAGAGLAGMGLAAHNQLGGE